MAKGTRSRIADILMRSEGELLAEWTKEQMSAITRRADLIDDAELREQSRAFLALVREGVESGSLDDLGKPEWARMTELLAEVSRSRARQGFTPSETAIFVFSVKQPLFARLRRALRDASCSSTTTRAHATSCAGA